MATAVVASPVPAQPAQPPQQPQAQYTAAYDFARGSVGEISLKKGDLIVITDKSDADWWSGTTL